MNYHSVMGSYVKYIASNPLGRRSNRSATGTLPFGLAALRGYLHSTSACVVLHHGASLAVETRLFGFIIPGLLLQSSQHEKLGSTAIHMSSDSYYCGPMYPIIHYRGVLRSRIHGRDVLKHRYLYNYVPYSAVMQDITHAQSWDTVHSCRVQGYISPQSPQDGAIAAGGADTIT